MLVRAALVLYLCGSLLFAAGSVLMLVDHFRNGAK